MNKEFQIQNLYNVRIKSLSEKIQQKESNFGESVKKINQIEREIQSKEGKIQNLERKMKKKGNNGGTIKEVANKFYRYIQDYWSYLHGRDHSKLSLPGLPFSSY